MEYAVKQKRVSWSLVERRASEGYGEGRRQPASSWYRARDILTSRPEKGPLDSASRLCRRNGCVVVSLSQCITDHVNPRPAHPARRLATFGVEVGPLYGSPKR